MLSVVVDRSGGLFVAIGAFGGIMKAQQPENFYGFFSVLGNGAGRGCRLL